MSPWTAWQDGWRRVGRAPFLAVGLWLATLAVALPLALLLRTALAVHFGSSLAGNAAASGANVDWWNEFLAQSTGIGQTFLPSTIGFAAVLRNSSAVADAIRMPGLIGVAVAAHLAATVFLIGGTFDRLARDRRIGGYGFLMACGLYFPRLLRLALLAGLAYWLLFASLHPWLFESLYPMLTRDLTVERTAFTYRAVLYAVFAIPLAFVNLIVDYAKVRLVVEDRRSAIGALAASMRFITRHPGTTTSLYLLNTLAFFAIVALYAFAAPDVSVSGWTALVIGQLYIIGRVLVRLACAASQLALFQSRLAHAGYTAAPTPKWPDSPAAEAILPR